MKERPILFSAPMVQALLDGRKTQTRRIVKSPGVNSRICPYGHTGDGLWVREGFKPIASGEVKNGYGEVRYGFAYKADGATRWASRPTIIHDLTNQPDTGPMQFQPRPWKSSIHMPRRASRILLEVTGIRVERLQDISEEDAIAEGLEVQNFTGFGDEPHLPHYPEPDVYRMQNGDYSESSVDAYRSLWESINSEGSWNANPWVWVIEFRRIES